MNKTIELTKAEAEAIYDVLENGMPNSQKKRDFLAKIWYKLDEFVSEVPLATLDTRKIVAYDGKSKTVHFH